MADEANSVVRICAKSEVTPGSVRAFAAGDKTLAEVMGEHPASGMAVRGYEMHIGRGSGPGLARPFLSLRNGVGHRLSTRIGRRSCERKRPICTGKRLLYTCFGMSSRMRGRVGRKVSTFLSHPLSLSTG